MDRVNFDLREPQSRQFLVSDCIFTHEFGSVVEEQGKPCTSVTDLKTLMSDLIKNSWKLCLKNVTLIGLYTYS